MAVNSLAVFVYASQELWLTAALYVGLFASSFWGYWEWRQALVSLESTWGISPISSTAGR